MFISITKRAAVNNIIDSQGIQGVLMIKTGILTDLVASIMHTKLHFCSFLQELS